MFVIPQESCKFQSNLSKMFIELKNYFSEKSVELTPDLEELMDSCLQRKTVSKNEIIVRQGEIGKYTYFVAKGLLRSYDIDENGKEHILQFAPENWLISDRSSTLLNEASELYIDAIEDSEIILLDNIFLEKATELNPSFQRFNLFALNNHIRQLQKRINLLIASSAEVRYLDFIRLYPNILQRVPQWMVASYLGITPESLSRVRKGLAKKKFIQ